MTTPYVGYVYEPGFPAPAGPYNVFDTLDEAQEDFQDMYGDCPGAWMDLYLDVPVGDPRHMEPTNRMTIGPRGGVKREVWR